MGQFIHTNTVLQSPFKGGDTVYAASVMLDINPDEIGLDYVIGPTHGQTGGITFL